MQKKTLWLSGPLVVVVCLQSATAQYELELRVQQGSSTLSTPNNVLQSFTIANCVTENLLAGDLAPGPASNSLGSFLTTGLTYAGSFSAASSVRFLAEPVEGLEQACLGFGGTTPTMPFVNCPEPTFLPCDATEAESDDYIRLDFTASAAVNSTSTLRRRAEARIRVIDDFVIDSPVAQMLELPITVVGDVLGAESFGDPNGTFGKASIGVLGVAFGMPVNVGIAVESVTTIPETAAINQTFTFPLSVPAGVSVHSFDLEVGAEMDARAQGAFIIVGAATAQVGQGSHVRLQRLRAVGGGPLAPGTKVIGGLTNTVYEDVAEVLSPYRIIPGCTTHNAVLYPTAAGASLPGQMDIALRSSLITDGFAFLFSDAEGTDAYGCGLFNLFGPQDVLLAGTGLVDVGASTIAAGMASWSIALPNNPVFSGFELAFQSIDIGAITSPGVELSTGLVATLDG